MHSSAYIAMNLLVLLSDGMGAHGEEQEVDDVLQSNLYLESNETGQHAFQGSRSSLLLEIKAARAGMRGTGCFFIFAKENFDGLIGKLEGSIPLKLSEEQTVRSVKFLQEGCGANVTNYPDKSTLILTGIGLAALCLALLGSAVVCQRQRQRGEHRVENMELGET